MDDTLMTDDVPMLGQLFDQDETTASAPAVRPAVVEEKPDAPVTVPAETDTQSATVTPPPAPAASSEVDSVIESVKVASSPTFPSPAVAAKVAATSSAATASAPSTPAAAAPLSPPSPPVTPEALADASDEAPAPLPEWQKSLTRDEQDILFSQSPLAVTTPKAAVSAVNVAKASYRIAAAGSVSEEQRNAEIAAVQASATVPTSVRKIENYSARARMNNELLRLATEDRETRVVLGVTDSAKFPDNGLGKVPWTSQDITAYARYAWSAYNGALFGAEEIVLDADGNPVVQLEGHDAPLKRPNGQLYFPRKVQLASKNAPTVYDTQMVRTAYENRIPVLLYGNPGTGKTALCEAVLTGLVTISGTADTETADFVGSYVQNTDGTFEWVDGPLIVAMEKGVPLFIDEIALIDSRVLALVYSVMDGRNEIVITANPKRGVITAKDGFYVVGACNPNVPGAVMSDALLSRFSLQMEVTTDYDMLKTLGVDRDIINVSKNLARMVEQGGGVMKAPETRELLAYMRIKKALGQEMALANLVSAALPVDREQYVNALRTKFDTEVMALST